MPFWYIKLTANHFKKDIAAELETALSIITTAYLRNEDILTAVEENIDYLNPPIKEVFREWCDALSVCQNDRSLKSTLTPIAVQRVFDLFYN